jgi:hypothetical protein
MSPVTCFAQLAQIQSYAYTHGLRADALLYDAFLAKEEAQANDAPK